MQPRMTTAPRQVIPGATYLVTLKLARPPGFQSSDAFRRGLSASLSHREQQAARDRDGMFLGVGKVLAQAPNSRLRPGEPRRGLNPRVGARDKRMTTPRKAALLQV
jgi:hypothetical protein